MIPARGTGFAPAQSLERLVNTFDEFPTSNKLSFGTGDGCRY